MPPKASQLCKSFPEVMKDTSSLSMLEYFIQYMEFVGALHLVQFWLTVESFKALAHSEPTLGELHSKRDTFRSPLCEVAICSIAEATCDITCSTGGSLVNSRTPMMAPGEGASSVEGTGRHGVTVHKGLQRRDTEHYKYCNCGIGIHTPPVLHREASGDLQKNCESPKPSPPPTPEYASPKLQKRLNGEHGTPKLKRLTQSLYGLPKPPTNNCGPPASKDDSTSNHISPEIKRSASLTLETDALEIYSKYLALNATHPIAVTDEIRQGVEVSICPADGKIDHSCFCEAQNVVYDLIEKRYFPGFLHSSYLCKYQLDYIGSGRLNLMDFLLGENALSYFMEFMEQESAASLLHFWMTAENFYSQLSSPRHVVNMEDDMSDAITIYNRYFSLQASVPLKMEDSIRMDVENRICDEHGPRADSYLRPQLVAFHTMNEVYFPIFCASSVYLRFLNELVQMRDDEPSQGGGGGGGGGGDRTKTDCCTPPSEIVKLSHSITGRDLDDPNSLWERPAFLFRLGFVDEFGVYISDIDSIPIKSKKDYMWTRSARLLRKHKKEEYSAMKIAKNIIQEVISSIASDNCLDSES